MATRSQPSNAAAIKLVEPPGFLGDKLLDSDTDNHEIDSDEELNYEEGETDSWMYEDDDDDEANVRRRQKHNKIHGIVGSKRKKPPQDDETFSPGVFAEVLPPDADSECAEDECDEQEEEDRKELALLTGRELEMPGKSPSQRKPQKPKLTLMQQLRKEVRNQAAAHRAAKAKIKEEYDNNNTPDADVTEEDLFGTNDSDEPASPPASPSLVF